MLDLNSVDYAAVQKASKFCWKHIVNRLLIMQIGHALVWPR